MADFDNGSILGCGVIIVGKVVVVKFATPLPNSLEKALQDFLWETQSPDTKKFVKDNREIQLYMTTNDGLILVVMVHLSSEVKGKAAQPLSGLKLAKVGWLLQQMEKKFLKKYLPIVGQPTTTAQAIRDEFGSVLEDLLYATQRVTKLSDFKLSRLDEIDPPSKQSLPSQRSQASDHSESSGSVDGDEADEAEEAEDSEPPSPKRKRKMIKKASKPAETELVEWKRKTIRSGGRKGKGGKKVKTLGKDSKKVDRRRADRRDEVKEKPSKKVKEEVAPLEEITVVKSDQDKILDDLLPEVARLKVLSQTISQELELHNQLLDQLELKTDTVDARIVRRDDRQVEEARLEPTMELSDELAFATPIVPTLMPISLPTPIPTPTPILSPDITTISKASIIPTSTIPIHSERASAATVPPPTISKASIIPTSPIPIHSDPVSPLQSPPAAGDFRPSFYPPSPPSDSSIPAPCPPSSWDHIPPPPPPPPLPPSSIRGPSASLPARMMASSIARSSSIAPPSSPSLPPPAELDILPQEEKESKKEEDVPMPEEEAMPEPEPSAGDVESIQVLEDDETSSSQPASRAKRIKRDKRQRVRRPIKYEQLEKRKQAKEEREKEKEDRRSSELIEKEMRRKDEEERKKMDEEEGRRVKEERERFEEERRIFEKEIRKREEESREREERRKHEEMEKAIRKEEERKKREEEERQKEIEKRRVEAEKKREDEEKRKREEEERKRKEEEEKKKKEEEEKKKKEEEEKKKKEDEKRRLEEERRRRRTCQTCIQTCRLWWQNRKKKKVQVDDVFADMENVFNGLSAWIVGCEPANACLYGKAFFKCCCYITRIPFFLFSLLFISGFSFTIMLPACFLLLVLRTKTVERKVENFAARQKVLASESVKKKTFRFVSLLVRAAPMLALLVLWPIFSVYYAIPKYNGDPSSVGLTVGLYICVIVLLQALGTVRSIRSFQLKKEIEFEEGEEKRQKELQENKEKQFNPEDFHIPPEDELIDKELKAEFRWKNFGNIVAIITLFVETIQLATFSLQTLAPQDKDKETPPPSQDGSISQSVIPALFINFAEFFASNVHQVYAWAGISVTIVLIVLFIFQFLRELRGFGHLKKDGQNDAANKMFFHSFVGSIVYGHGELKGVSPKISAIAALLSDTLFMAICGKMLLVVTCSYNDGQSTLMINKDVVCWQGDHKLLATLTLIAFGYYLPLSAMIAPMLVESDNAVGKDGKPKKDVTFVKPFLSCIVVSKCILLVAGTFFGGGDPKTTVVSSMIVFILLFLLSSYWATQRSFQQDRYGLGEPCWPPFINVWRSLAFAGGAVGAFCALLAEVAPNKLGGDAKFGLLFALIVLLFAGGRWWYKKWRAQATAQELVVKQAKIEKLKEERENDLLKKVLYHENGTFLWKSSS